jgi:SAM-dependent methyltransferase
MEHVANEQMAAAWAEEGERWARFVDEHDRATAAHHRRLMEAAAIEAADRVLDIGCGNGWTTLEAATLARDGGALGVDLSALMLERARERAAAEGIMNVEFVQADVQVHAFPPGELDVAISKFGCMFFNDPVAAFTNVRTAQRVGGRLALVVWQELGRNEWLLALRGALALGRDLPTPAPGTPGPFGLADRAHASDVLERAGYRAIDIVPFTDQVFVGRDLDEAFEFARNEGPAQGALQGLGESDRELALANLRDMLASHATADGVVLPSAAWLITARA